MQSRRLHKYIGLAMLLPLIGWSITGLIFLTKPGYEGAYETLHLKTYPLEPGFPVPITRNWDEVRVVKSILGTHMLVKARDRYLNLNPLTRGVWPVPDKEQLTALFEDAISHNKERYGAIQSLEQTTAHTTTGIKIELNWNQLKFSQQGLDREVIGTLYKIHYLQWTPWPLVNQILGVTGLALLVTLTVLGVRLYLANRG